MRALIVSEDEILRRMVRLVLGEGVWAFEEASDAAQARARMGGGWRLLILDVDTPGVAALAPRKGNGPPALALTVGDKPALLRALGEHSDAVCLLRPFDPTGLKARVAALTAPREKAAAPPPVEAGQDVFYLDA